MFRKLTAFMIVIVLIFASVQIAGAESYRTMKRGSRGEDVKEMQQALKEQGFYDGKTDGVYGKGTMNAVKAFQSENGL